MIGAEDAEFRTVIVRTLIVGGTMLAISAAALLVAFRSFGRGEGRDANLRSVVLLVAAILLIIISCIILLRFSVAHQW